jgi:type I restriction enzyme S subunit
MDISRVVGRQMIERLDAEYYGPEVLALVLSLEQRAHKKLGSLLTAMRRHPMCYGFAQTPQQEDDLIPYFKGEDLTDLALLGASSFVDGGLFDNFKKAQTFCGDLVFSVRGTIGRTAVNRYMPGLASPNTIVLAPNPTTDPEFLSAFLNCRHGQLLIQREMSGTVQDTITEDCIRRIQAVSPTEKAQTYIGDKVRCAQRLREHARRLEAEFTKTMQARVPEAFGPVQAKGKHSRARVSLLTTNLNAGAYNPERLRVRGEVQDKGGKHLASVATALTPTSDSYAPDCIYIGLDSVSSSTCELQPSTVQDEEVAGTVRVFPEGPVISRLRPYLNKVSYIGAELVGAAGSTELMCVHARAGVSPWYLYGVLKLPCTMTQLNPVATGSTHPRITRDDILDLIVPWHPDSEALGAALSAAQLSYHSARRLTAAAKYLVEALIDGKVTETDLVQAQDALERHDRGPDRALLARLTAQGMDVPDAKPLFPDLDKLYALLDQDDGESPGGDAQGT